MTRTADHVERRRRELARMLARNQSVSTVDAARRFGVNPMTIRRDLKALEQSGRIVRCYGGAVPAQRITFEFAFDQRRQRHRDSKRRIGEAAAQEVEAGQTVFLDTGTTTLEIARALVRRAIACRVATNSLVIAGALWGHDEIELFVLGGGVRRGSPDLTGPGTEVMLDRLTADVAFVGSDGIDPTRGCFAEDIEAARVAERMATNAARAIVVADGSKLGRAGRAMYLAIAGMKELITDRGADRKTVAALRRRGVRVVFA